MDTDNNMYILSTEVQHLYFTMKMLHLCVSHAYKYLSDIKRSKMTSSCAENIFSKWGKGWKNIKSRSYQILKILIKEIEFLPKLVLCIYRKGWLHFYILNSADFHFWITVMKETNELKQFNRDNCELLMPLCSF